MKNELIPVRMCCLHCPAPYSTCLQVEIALEILLFDKTVQKRQDGLLGNLDRTFIFWKGNFLIDENSFHFIGQKWREKELEQQLTVCQICMYSRTPQ